VEEKAHIFDPTVLLDFVQKIKHTHLSHFVPVLATHPAKQIEIEVIRTQSTEEFIQDSVEIVMGFNVLQRGFHGDNHFVSELLNRLAHYDFVLPPRYR